ncbi:DUF433 domain-containing protein [Microcoleus sp. herbarium2]|uniref:DUF433 domain-containing protein n=1 Tax=Microcoleus sp. herbarium2 TaxID=3055433 RepID=UPI002FD409AA
MLSELLTQKLANTWQGISKTPGVCGGDACMRNTRIPVWVLESFRRLGMNESRLLDNYSNRKSLVNFLLPPRGFGEGWGGVKNL